MRKLLVYLKDYKKECILAPLFKMLEASFELFVPIVMASLIDNGIATGNKGFVYRECTILMILGVIGLICSVTAQYFSARAAVGYATQVRHSLFEHLLSLSFTEIDTIGTSTMITRMTSDVNQTQTGVNMVLRLFLRSPFVVFGAMIMAFTIDVKAALIFVAAIIGLSMVVFVIMALNIPMLGKVQKNLDGVLRITRENLTGIRVIRAFCKEEDETASFIRKNQELTNQQKKSGNLSGLMNPLTYVLINLAIVVLIHTGAVQVSNGILTQGQVVALYNYMSQILVELIKLANLIVTINKSIACGDRIAQVFEMQPGMQEGPGVSEYEQGENIIEYKNVGLTYAGASEESLTDISFAVKKGQIVGIIGGTGSGKTSLVHLLTRFYDATRGEVLIHGKNVKEYKTEQLRQFMSIVMQKAVLFQGSIQSNLGWRKQDASKDEYIAAIKAAQADDVVDKKGGLTSEIEQEGRNLSGGQKQRLSIARSLMGQPEILILDDSSSALDFATDASLRKAIRELPESPTVFLVSQRTSSIRYADLILVLDDGRLMGKGTHDELLQTCEVYREIYESQYKKEEKRG